MAKAAVRALPVPAATKRRARTWLSTTAAGSRLLGWLAPAPAAAAPSSTAAIPLDKEAVRAEAEAELSLFLDGAKRLNLRRGTGQPQVSVVIVLYNQAGLSLLCLRALSESMGVDFETIIVDNASSDRMPQLLERLDGADILRQDSNLGFLRAVNLAAEHATGEQLLLLNNDAVLEPQTLAHAMARLAAEPDAGAVGGPILLWDGRLQEAGSIIWRDGSCQGYGRGDSPDAPAYRFVRDVDYCSGAFLMVRRALFEQLGRFDDGFAPAYYEESDFCVRLWEAGHRIVYDPRVRVKHFEFASDTGSGSGQAMALQARNRERFVAKHESYLRTRPEADPSRVLEARQILRPGARRVLIIDDRVPLPDLGRGYPRAALVAATIGDGADALTYYPLQIADGRWDEVYSVLNPRTEVMLDLGIAGLPKFLSQRAGQFDLILVSRPHNMESVVALRASHPDWFKSARIVYDAEALFCLRTIERAKVMGRPLSDAKARSLLNEELALARGADRIVAVSQDEARHYHQAGCTDVVVLGHALTPQASAPAFEQRQGFLFVGAITQDDCPNGDSVLWFVREVWPLVQAALGPDAVLDVVGVCESAAVRALNSPSIRVHGRVADLAPYFDRRRVFIVPTRFAAGVPHKAHEAASRGLPIVATPLIACQLGWHDEVLVADGAPAFAQACIRLHGEPSTWLRLRNAALAAVERDCSPTAFRRAVREIVR
jgi:GT2 family glycosyltransferase